MSPVEVASIVVRDGGFDPPVLRVVPGTKIAWSLQTYETVRVATEANVSAELPAFDSGPINLNWAGEGAAFSVTLSAAGQYWYGNAHVAPWDGRFYGLVDVRPQDCAGFPDCTACLIYDHCIWCLGAGPGNGSCIGRVAATNMPVDSGVVINISLVAPNAGVEHAC